LGVAHHSVDVHDQHFDLGKPLDQFLIYLHEIILEEFLRDVQHLRLGLAGFRTCPYCPGKDFNGDLFQRRTHDNYD
jgi:hypothetical protein